MIQTCCEREHLPRGPLYDRCGRTAFLGRILQQPVLEFPLKVAIPSAFFGQALDSFHQQLSRLAREVGRHLEFAALNTVATVAGIPVVRCNLQLPLSKCDSIMSFIGANSLCRYGPENQDGSIDIGAGIIPVSLREKQHGFCAQHLRLR